MNKKRTFALLRTNPYLSGNVKILVNNDYSLFLESFPVNTEMNTDRYRYYRMSFDSFYDEVLSEYFRDTPIEYIYEPPTDIDGNIIQNSYQYQYETIYWSGGDYISDKQHNESYQYFAPLLVDKTLIPKHFIVFRVDGNGANISLDRTTFNSEILSKLKVVKHFDLSPSTNLGLWLDKNIRNNDSYPNDNDVFVDFREAEFTEVTGIDIVDSGFLTKSLFLDDFLEQEQSYYNTDKFFTNLYKDNALIYHKILNFKFLFNDIPATPTSLRTWSCNRYLGFYFDDLKPIEKFGLYTPFELIPNYVINSDNEFTDALGNYIDPFVKGYNPSNTYYVEYLGSYYLVTRTLGLNATPIFKIIADFSLGGLQGQLNQKILNFTGFNTISNQITGFNNYDMVLIKIIDQFYVIKFDGTNYFLNTDYGFTLNNNKLEVFINNTDPNFTKTYLLSAIDANIFPQSAEVYYGVFTPIVDFDTVITDTDMTKFEYEELNLITNTSEPKFYAKDYTSNGFPKPLQELIYNSKTENIPISSEYLSNFELFELTQDTLSDIWNKTPRFFKWGYDQSLSNSDTKYRLNNSIYNDDWNLNPNISLQTPNRTERNLDYFYSINPATSSYIHYSLHITDPTHNLLNFSYSFNVQQYFTDSNYFKTLFSTHEYINNGLIKRQVNKYSSFINSSEDLPNVTLFKGMRFNIWDVDNIQLNNNGEITTVNLLSTNDFDNWDFSILLSPYEGTILKNGNFTAASASQNQWTPILNWDITDNYLPNAYVFFKGIVFESVTNSTINNPTDNPYTSTDWTYSSLNNSILFSPAVNYVIGDYVFYQNDYYLKTGTVGVDIDFWYPTGDFSLGQQVIYNNQYYENIFTTGSGIISPDNTLYWQQIVGTLSTVWTVIKEWQLSTNYNLNDYVTQDDNLYISLQNNNFNQSPQNATAWGFLYDFTNNKLAPNNSTYNNTKVGNSVIKIGGVYHYLTSVAAIENSSGINVYLNKKSKSVLIHLYVEDGTTPYNLLKNINRDDLYQPYMSRFTAANLISALGNLNDRYDFSNELTYYIIEEDGSFNYYSKSFNITQLPYYITISFPDDLFIKNDSLGVNGISLTPNLIKIKSVLNDLTINNPSQINWYIKNLPIAYNIVDNPPKKPIKNYSGLKNDLFLNLKRFSGNYKPITYEIELFDRSISEYVKFDTTLTKFGEMKELIYSKVNLETNDLLFSNSTSLESIYPMIDEYGYSYDMNFFIFKSNFDLSYYKKSTKL